MTALFVAEGIGQWAFNRGISSVLDATGSNDADSYAKQAQRLFETRDYKGAEGYALAGIERSPMHQKALRTLGMARTALGREAAGRDTMLAAGKLGWQDVATQTWLMWDALQRGQPQRALLRAEALARRGSMAPGLFRIMTAFATDPTTRPLLVARMAKSPEWQTQAYDWRAEYFGQLASASAEEARTAEGLLRALASAGSQPRRAEVAPVVRRLVDLGDYARAQGLASALMNGPVRTAGNAVADGNFARADLYEADEDELTPFQWQLVTSPGATAVVETTALSGDGVLYVETNGVREAVLARQLVRVPAGTRTLAFTMKSSDPDAQGRFGWSLSCAEDGRELLSSRNAAASDGGSRRLGFTVPASGCAFQQLELRAEDLDERRNGSAMFDSIAIR